MGELSHKQSSICKLMILSCQLLGKSNTAKEIRKNLKNFEDLWLSFEQNDEVVRLNNGKTEKDEGFYFTEGLYRELQEGYCILIEKLDEIERVKTGKKNVNDVHTKKIEVLEVSTPGAYHLHYPQDTELIQKLIRNNQRYRLIISFDNKSKNYNRTKIESMQEKWDTRNNLLINMKQKMKDDEESSHTLSNIKSKFPLITLPKFEGDYTKWTQFRELFNELIDKQPLPKVEKMRYLKTNMNGEVANLICHLSVSEHNYDVAWKILNERYNNPILLVSTIIDKFLNQPSLVRGSNEELKYMYDSTKEYVLALENQGLKIDGCWDPIMLQILLKKLDKDTYFDYEQSLENPKELQSLQNFLKFIEMRFQSFEAE